MLKQISAGIIVALIFLGIGIFIGVKIPKKQISQTGTENTYQAGWDAAREKIKQSPSFATMQPAGEVKSVSGTIQKINGNKITIKTFQMDPLADESLSERIVVVDSNSKISLNVQKSSEKMQAEMQAFQEKMKTQNSDPAKAPEAIAPPIPFEEKTIALSDLKEGQSISVISSENIGEKKELVAQQIIAQEALKMQTLPTMPASPEVPVVK